MSSRIYNIYEIKLIFNYDTHSAPYMSMFIIELEQKYSVLIRGEILIATSLTVYLDSWLSLLLLCFIVLVFNFYLFHTIYNLYNLENLA